MSDIDNKELDRMLQQAFEASTKIYQQRGFQRRVGFGKRPALVSVDLANAWTRGARSAGVPRAQIANRTGLTSPSARGR